MADDQATLGRFADGESGQDDEVGPDDRTATDGTPDRDDHDRPDSVPVGGTAEEGPACPWCLAPAAAFEDGGPTGRSCGRCSAALPVGADWFLAGEVVARRPMYGTDRGD